jgi:hypothetical protein
LIGFDPDSLGDSTGSGEGEGALLRVRGSGEDDGDRPRARRDSSSPRMAKRSVDETHDRRTNQINAAHMNDVSFKLTGCQFRSLGRFFRPC